MPDEAMETPEGVELTSAETTADEVLEEEAPEGSMKALVDGEELLESPEEIWWRQCAPGYYDERTAKPSDTIFRWNEKDNGQLSGARSSKASAEASYLHRTVHEGMGSKGTWGVSVAEVTAAESRLIDDPANLPAPPDSPPGHTYLDVRHTEELGKQERQRFRSTLLIYANARGRQFPV